jgi:hypothetical protein
MTFSENLVLALKAARQLGIEQTSLYAQYQIALRSGWLRRITAPKEPADTLDIPGYKINGALVNVPERDQLTRLVGDQASALLAEAKDLNQGKVRLFGGPPQDLDLVVPLPLQHWTYLAIDPSKSAVEDIKLVWEPARFTWIYPLVRAYILSGDESFPETFWQEFEAFTDINLPNMGPNWVSAQEVAIRLISFVFAYQVFCSTESCTDARINHLSRSIADHAERIPPTINYARSQNNNHLLSEAAGLITAGRAIPDHPKADSWINTGRRWFNHALENQISSAGTYTQHSTNYHRMMLQLALWVSNLEDSITQANKERLADATKWLLGLIDPDTGRVPNLGHNDGSYCQPFTSCSYADYRPVVQAAALKFLNEQPFPDGPWDELAFWFGSKKNEHKQAVAQDVSLEAIILNEYPESHLTMHDQASSTWACLRAARYQSRPAHADQLHIDLWWREHNVALDAGTYSYNAPPPWDNALIHTEMHNTVTINGIDQMMQAGRFLWLDWAQAEIIDKKIDPDGKRVEVIAHHQGYHAIGVMHQRIITCESSNKWIIKDELISSKKNSTYTALGDKSSSLQNNSNQSYKARLHWLLPDWSWEVISNDQNQESEFRIRSPLGWINIQIGTEPATKLNGEHNELVVQLVRAGELIHGSGTASPVAGWISPTYGYKIPALSLAFEIESRLPIFFTTIWEFPQPG